MCQIRHPSFVRVYGPSSSKKEQYLVVTEFVHGTPVRDLMSDADHERVISPKLKVSSSFVSFTIKTYHDVSRSRSCGTWPRLCVTCTPKMLRAKVIFPFHHSPNYYLLLIYSCIYLFYLFIYLFIYCIDLFIIIC